MFATGFSMRADEMAAHEGVIVEGVRTLARRHGVFLVAGFADRGPARPRNAAGVFDPAGGERAPRDGHHGRHDGPNRVHYLLAGPSSL
jgi:predicted amidohydrolase